MNLQFAALAFGVLLISAPAGTAPSGDRTEPCATAFQFEPGNDRYRQQTPAETDAQALSDGQQGGLIANTCRTTPRGRQEVLMGSRPDTAIGAFLVSAALP